MSEATMHHERAIGFSVQGRFAEAITGFDAAIRLCPNYADAYSDRGAALMTIGDYDKAIADYDAALRLVQEPQERARTYSRRAMVRTAKGDLDGALSDINEALKLDGACSTALSSRSFVWQRKGDWTKAIADASKLAEVHPDNPLGYTMLALMYAGWPDAACRNAERAISSAKRACEMTSWKDAQSLAGLAAGYAEKGDFDEAIRWQKKAEELAPALRGGVPDSPLKLYMAKKPYRLENIGTHSKAQAGTDGKR